MTTTTVDRLAHTIATKPGVTTKDLYFAVGANTPSEQAYVRQTLKRWSRTNKLKREPRTSPNGGPPTFAYFPSGTAATVQPMAVTPPAADPTPRTVGAPAGWVRTGVGKGRGTRRKTVADIGRLLNAIGAYPTGVSSNQLDAVMAPLARVTVRRHLRVLREAGKVLCVPGKHRGQGRGKSPDLYFPKTAEGREAMAQYIASGNEGTRHTPRTYTRRPTTPTPTSSNGGLTVQQVVRITLPSGRTEELDMQAARQFYDSLAPLFA